MAARSGRNPKFSHSRAGRFGTRPVETRNALPVIAIVCDDERTAVAYFNEIKREVRMKLTLKVVSKPKSWASANEVVDEAIRVRAELQRDEDEGEEQRDSVWALLDLEDTDVTAGAATTAKVRAEEADVNVALSKPCYELWSLLHLEDTGESFADCRAVIERLKQQWRRTFDQEFRKKAQADYSKILSLRSEAAKRAKRHRTNNDPSWTDVYLVIEKIDTIFQYPG